MTSHPITEEELHAYVDDVLPPERRADVEEHLARHQGDAERVATYQAQKQALKALFQPVLDEPVPDHLLALTAQPIKPPMPRGGWRGGGFWQQLAAGVLVAALGGAGGWLAHGHYQSGERMARALPLPHQAAVAHVVYSPDVRRPVEISADQEEALVKWLTKRLGTPVSPPKLGALGYELVGGRLLPGNSGPVAQFMYQDSSGQRMTLYVTTESTEKRDTGFRFAREGLVNVFYWVDGKFGYALSAGIDKGELAKVATTVYDQLDQK
jgi:anti-sigma factor RsiW